MILTHLIHRLSDIHAHLNATSVLHRCTLARNLGQEQRQANKYTGIFAVKGLIFAVKELIPRSSSIMPEPGIYSSCFSELLSKSRDITNLVGYHMHLSFFTVTIALAALYNTPNVVTVRREVLIDIRT